MIERLDLFSRLVKLFCRKSERKDVAINFSFDLTEALRRHARFVSMITTKNWRGIKEKDEEQKARSKMATMTIITEQRSCTVAKKFQQKSFPSLSLSLFLPAFPTSQQAASALKNNEAQGTKLLPNRGSGWNFENGYVVTGTRMLGKFLHRRSSRLWEAVIKPWRTSQPAFWNATPYLREFSPVPSQILRAYGDGVRDVCELVLNRTEEISELVKVLKKKDIKLPLFELQLGWMCLSCKLEFYIYWKS